MHDVRLGSRSVFRAAAGPVAALFLGCAAAWGVAGCVGAKSDGGTGGGPTGAGGGSGNAGASGSGGATGTGGGATGTGGATAGTGGNVAGTGGVTGGSGGTGSGGSTGAGTGGKTGGSGGSAGSTGSAGAGGAADCSTLPLCDTFEATAANAAPNSALWTLISQSSSDTATVDGTMGANGSAHSLKVVGADRIYLRNSAVIGTLGSVAHVRFYVRFATALAQGHGALMVTHPTPVDQYTQSNELRFGSQDNVFHWNTDSDAANIPDVSPSGDAASFKPAALTWYCVELTINTSNGHLSVSVDGNDIPGLDEDGVATANIDQSWINSGSTSLSRYTALADFNLGWDSYGAGALTLWYDDIALSSGPIGCQ